MKFMSSIAALVKWGRERVRDKRGKEGNDIDGCLAYKASYTWFKMFPPTCISFGNGEFRF